MAFVFLTGATGYMGRRLATDLLARGHRVRGLARPASLALLPPGCEPVAGNALAAGSFQDAAEGCDTLVHLVGVSHPGPAKAAQFRSVDLASAREAITAAVAAKISHFVYVSVAHPAPVMHAYIAARAEAEGAIAAAGLNATILRPWYVLGPGHRWPVLLKPVYRLLSALPSTQEAARRLGLLTLAEMTAALVAAVENPANGISMLDVPRIRAVANGRVTG